jgi:inhibitor of cysteine peptidase
MSKIRLGIMFLLIGLIVAMIPTAVCVAPNTGSQNHVITENDNGGTIILKKGDVFSLKLKENPSTGYSWQLSLSKGLSLLETLNYSPESSQNTEGLVVGAGGYNLWRIKATDYGLQQVKGIYKRSWETRTGHEQTFKLNVIVV